MIIEPQIASLVNAMNASGYITTLASCQGHWDGRTPFVYFATSVEVSKSLEKVLRAGGVNGLYPLNFWWNVTENLHPEHGLVFSLETTAFAPSIFGKLLGTVWTLGLNRTKIATDLQTLILVLEEALLSPVGQNLRKSIKASNG
jgi:hypothetical protein